jgi:hypothetical protein
MSNNNAATILAVFGLILGLVAGYAYFRPEIINYQNEVSTMENEILNYENEVDDLQSEINSLGADLTKSYNDYDDLIDEYNSRVEDLVFEVEQLYSEYESVLTQYMDILSSYQPPYDIVDQYYDDFTEYRKTDLDNSISISESRVSWINMDRSIGRNIWREYDAVYSSDFVHKFTFSMEQIEAGDVNPREIVRLWTLKGDDVSLILYVVQANSRDDIYDLVFFQKDQHGNIFVYHSSDDNDSLLVGEVYFVTITKQDDVYRVYIFDDVNTLLDSGSHVGVSVDYETLTIVSVGGYSDDLDDWSSGYVENLRVFN